MSFNTGAKLDPSQVEDVRGSRIGKRGLAAGGGLAQRLKLSGMRWTVRGAAAIVNLRCQDASGRLGEDWGRIHTQMGAA